MALIVKPYTFSSGATIIAAEHNSNFDALFNDYNGNITNANLSSAAAIQDSKLAQITSGSKVNISALTVTSQATGDLIYASGATTWARLGVGTTSQVIIGGTNPTWGAVPAVTTASMPVGSVVQVVNSQLNSVVSCAGNIPFDDTIPQITEGTEITTLAITPTSATNNLRIDISISGATSNDGVATVALFQDATANALAVGYTDSYGGNNVFNLSFSYYMVAGTTSATTFRVRAGKASGSIYINGATGGTRAFGGVSISGIAITEIKA